MTDGEILQGQNIICIGSANWDGLWVNAQHMMYRLAERNRVLYVESLGLRAPSIKSGADRGKILHRLRSFLQGRRKPYTDRELYLFSPFVIPLYQYKAMYDINMSYLRYRLKRETAALEMTNPLLWLFLPTGAGLIGQMQESGIVYYCVDDYSRNPGAPARIIEFLEKQIMQKADLVFTTSPALYEDKQRWHKHTYYTPNAADTQIYAAEQNSGTPVPGDIKNIPAPVLGFIGNITGYKIDFKLLRNAATLRPGWNFVLIGPVGEGDPQTDISALDGLPNVHLLGRREKEQLPAYVSRFDIGLIPYRLNASTRASFPMKFYEYLAAGLPVVSTRLHALADYEARPELCSLVDDAGGLIAAVETYLAENGHKDSRRAEAEKYDWTGRLQFVSDKIRKHIKQPRQNLVSE
ncbi:glycosyltransferase [Planctomycetota bacterium]